MSPAAKQPRKPAAAPHEHVDRISTRTTFVVLIVIVIVLYEIQWILLPFAISGLLAFICTPVVDVLTQRLPLPRPLWAIAVFLGLATIAALIGLLGAPPLIRELTRIVTDLQGTMTALARGALGDRTVTLFGQPMDAQDLAKSAVTAWREWLGQAGRVATIGTIALSTAFGAILTWVLLFYFLLSGKSIAQGLVRLVPPKQRPLILQIWSRLDPVLKRYFVGVIVVVIYAAIAAYVGLGLFLGIPHAVFLALLTGILEMIPVVGPGASAVIAGLVAIRYATGITAILAYALYATALRLSIDQFFGPLALGAAARLHPTLIIFCFLSGGVVFGIVGVIMAIPVALAVKVTLAILYDEPSPVEPAPSAKEGK